MRTVSADRASIDYWQDYGTGRQVLKSHFGIRVWEDRCCAITNVASGDPQSVWQSASDPGRSVGSRRQAQFVERSERAYEP
jgi:hypothetical protein